MFEGVCCTVGVCFRAVACFGARKTPGRTNCPVILRNDGIGTKCLWLFCQRGSDRPSKIVSEEIPSSLLQAAVNIHEPERASWNSSCRIHEK